MLVKVCERDAGPLFKVSDIMWQKYCIFVDIDMDPYSNVLTYLVFACPQSLCESFTKDLNFHSAIHHMLSGKASIAVFYSMPDSHFLQLFL